MRDRLEAIGAPGADRKVESLASTSEDDAEEIEWEIAELENMVKPALSEDFGFRWREGEEGLSQLTEFSVPFAYSVTLGAGRLTATAEPVFLSAGTLGEDPVRLRRIGALATVEQDLRLSLIHI